MINDVYKAPCLRIVTTCLYAKSPSINIYISLLSSIIKPPSTIKEGGLIRVLTSNFKPTFYPAQFIHSHADSQGVHSAAAGPLTTALYTRAGRVSADNSIVYDFYALAARWTVHTKIDAEESYHTYKIFGVRLYH